MRAFNTRFARPLPKNVLALIKEKQAEALEEANVYDEGNPLPEPLKEFIEFNRARPKEPHFPFVTCYRRRTGKISQEDLVIGSIPEFAVEIGAEGDTEDATMDELEMRVEAVDSIIRTAASTPQGREQLLSEFAPEIKGLVNIEITEHIYGQNVPQGNKHIRVAALTLTAQLVEV